MLLEELDESWDGNIEGVIAIVVMDAIDLGLGGKSLALLEVLEGGLRFGVENV